MKTINPQSISIILALIIVYFSTDIMSSIPRFDELMPENYYLRVLILRILDYSPLFVVTLVFFRKNDLYEFLGLQNSPIRGFNVALLFCTPLLIIFVFTYSLNNSITGKEIWSEVLTPAFFEEVAYRGIVFGSLYYTSNWKFFPAVILNATVFGVGHLYQSTDPLEALFIFSLTFIASIWYSWLYAKWNRNLYIPIFLHLLMNFLWLLFGVSDNAAGSLIAHLAQVMTLLVSVLYTLYHTGEGKIRWKGLHPSKNSGNAVDADSKNYSGISRTV